MTKSKAAKIAEYLNACGEHPSHHKRVANEKADELRVGLYWLGTASSRGEADVAEVYALHSFGRMLTGHWTRKIGEIVRGHDGVWRS